MVNNTYIYNAKELLELKLINISVDETGGLTTGAYGDTGIIESIVIETADFVNLVPSWNAVAKNGATIEVLISARIKGNFTGFFSAGTWSRDVRGSIGGQREENALMDIDTLKIKSGNTADAFIFKLVLKKGTDDGKLSFKRAAFTLKYAVAPIIKSSSEYPDFMDIKVPKREQMTVPEVGNIICSPTSLSMILDFYGSSDDTRAIAELAKDQGAEIYGNWPFTAAVATEFGLKSYVKRLHDLEEAKEYIVKGIPLVASVGIKDKNELKGAESSYPDGHLLVIRGFKKVNDKEFVLVNDPATSKMDNIYREYDYNEFKRAFSGIVYVVEKP
ncbi:MAG: C39 family peptidase [Clostridiaceae bacterium]